MSERGIVFLERETGRERPVDEVGVNPELKDRDPSIELAGLGAPLPARCPARDKFSINKNLKNANIFSEQVTITIGKKLLTAPLSLKGSFKGMTEFIPHTDSGQNSAKNRESALLA